MSVSAADPSEREGEAPGEQGPVEKYVLWPGKRGEGCRWSDT